MKREREGFCARRFTGDDEHPAPKSDRSVHGMAKQGQAFARSGFDQQTGGMAWKASLCWPTSAYQRSGLPDVINGCGGTA
jgi:hypothetical protein